ncbi:MAG: geranylgeranylglyceryl/heptaprenylglyceryl phosphate synthase [Bacteroidota bacterium]
MKASLTDHLYQLKAEQQKAFAILLDPDHVPADEAVLRPLVHRLEAATTDLILVGGSLTVDRNIHALVPLLQSLTQLPIVLFPGSPEQIVSAADGILLLSLLSGRNPDYLIGRHVEAAPLLKQSELEILPTGYLLIDAGAPTTVNYMSNTLPIPHNKPQIAMCTALAGEQLGLRFIYMDGGSGAQRIISTQMVSEVSEQLSIPLMIGGGIRSGRQAEAIWRAGADIIVVGTALEQTDGEDLLTDLATIKAIFKTSSQTHTENA